MPLPRLVAANSFRRRPQVYRSGRDLNEDLSPGETAAAYVQRLAEEKAQAVWNTHRSLDTADDPPVVPGADTCVVCDGHILGKPIETADARRMLELLSGRTHAVLTGLAAVTGDKIVRDVEITQATFNELNDAEIAHILPGVNEWIKLELTPSRVMPLAGYPASKGATSMWSGFRLHVRSLCWRKPRLQLLRWAKRSLASALDCVSYPTLAIIAASRAVRGTRCSMTTDSCAA